MKKLVLFVFSVFAAVYANAFTATVKAVSGKVEVQEAGMWTPLEVGDPIEKGAVISTGYNSSLEISVKGSVLTLGPLTRITVEKLIASENKDTTQIYIDSGVIAADVSSSEGRRTGFKVRSAVATASVRGTSFTFTSSGKLSVDQGLVAFGASESSSAEVDEVSQDDPQAENAVASESNSEGDGSGKSSEHAGALASTEDVGGEGVPVAAGQVSRASTTGATPSNPRSELAAAASGGVDNTTSLTIRNAVGAGVSSNATPVVQTASETSAVLPTTGAVNATIITTGNISVSTTFED